MLVLIGGALWELRGQLPSILAVWRSTHPRWGLVALASGVTLATYALLIETWRRTLVALGGRLRARDAAVIWLGSNLARYIPGIGWQIGAMGAMAQRRGVPVAVSTAASLLVTIVNTFTGLAIFLGGILLLAVAPSGVPSLNARGLTLLVFGALALLASPLLMPRLLPIVARLTGRDLTLPRFSARALLVALVGTSVAWLSYGVAFWILARAVLPGDATRSLVGCITVYTSSYLVGLFNPMPAGIGAAEPVMVLLAPQLGIATTAEATVLALFVRAWRTIMEIVPNLIVLGIASLAERDMNHQGEGA